MLAARVRTEYPSGSILFGQVRSTAPHGSMFEFGTRKRQNDRKANRGTMPAAKQFVPIAQAWRRRTWKALGAMLERRGFTVTGED